MKTFVLIIGVLIACASAQNYEHIEDSPADKIKDNSGKCYVEKIGLMDKGAELKVPEKCEKVLCLDGGKYKVIQCPPLIVEPPCYAVYPDKPFPECCTFEIKCMKVPSAPTPPTRN